MEKFFETLFRPEVLAAALSAVATLLAAVAAFRAPLSAAKYAETLRRDGAEAENRRRIAAAEKIRFFSAYFGSYWNYRLIITS